MYNIVKELPRNVLYLVIPGIISVMIITGLFVSHASALTMSGTNSNGTYNVMIMTHLCNPNIKDWNDFENMESGKTPTLAIATDVLACPTTGLSASMPVTGAIASPRSTYNFSVMSDQGTWTLANNGTFKPAKICESDVGADLNNDGIISSSTCLDISHYGIPVTTGSSTIMRVMQTQAPAGYHFGSLRFTPVSLDGNNDASDLAYMNPETGEIDLNMVPDKDGMIMLHVYEFVNATSTATSTTGTGGMGGGSSDGGSSTTTSGLGASIRASIQARLQSIFGSRGF
jgi:hypothetical protein